MFIYIYIYTYIYIYIYLFIYLFFSFVYIYCNMLHESHAMNHGWYHDLIQFCPWIDVSNDIIWYIDT